MPCKEEARVLRENCWDLVIHYYPRAALNNVKPIVILNFSQKYEEKDDPASYMPHILEKQRRNTTVKERKHGNVYL